MTSTESTLGSAGLFELSVRLGSESCEIEFSAGAYDHKLALAGRPGELLSVPVVSQTDLTLPGTVTVTEPSNLMGVEAINSLSHPSWVSECARPIANPDVVSQDSSPHVRLANGWAPRELVADAPVRWVGCEAAFELAPNLEAATLVIKGIVGPCLGRLAQVRFESAGILAGSHALDLEDGQPFTIEQSVDELSRPDRLLMNVVRPNPRYNEHDVRVLNLLVKEVSLR